MNPNIFNRKFIAIIFSWMITGSYSALSCAGMVLNGTRVVYSAEQREVTVNMKNTGANPVLVQSWIDMGNPSETPDKIVSPFILTPPITRVDAGKGQTLRISLVDGKKLSSNKESVFYLNVLEIPASSKSNEQPNRLSIAFRTRVKLFYRPQGLPGNADDAPEQLKWNLINGGVMVNNPTAYYVTLGTVTYSTNGQKYIAEGNMIAPGASDNIYFKNVSTVSDIHSLSFTSLNDYGASVKHTQIQ